MTKLLLRDAVGIYILALSLVSPVILLTNLSLRAVLATDAKQEFAFADYHGLRLLSLPLAAFLILSGGLFLGYRAAVMAVVAALMLSKMLESLSEILYGLLQQHERMDRIARSMILRISLMFLAAGVVLGWKQDLFMAILAQCMMQALVLLFYDLPQARGVAGASWGWWGDLARMQALLYKAFPLGGVAMLLSLNSSLPRLFLERWHGEEVLGVFGPLAYLLFLGATFVAALGQAALPRLSQYIASRKRAAFFRLLGILMGFGAMSGLGGALVAWLAGRPILALLYKAEYAQYNELFIALLASSSFLFVASFLGYAAAATRQFQYFFWPVVVQCLATVLLCLWWIPEGGLYGAVWVSAGSYLVTCAVNGFILWRALTKAALFSASSNEEETRGS